MKEDAVIDSLKIGGTNYRVVYEDDPRNDEGRVVYGQLDYATATIWVNCNLEQSVQLATILHEALHGILNHAGYVGEHPEQMIEVLGNGLLQVLGDNGHLLEMLAWPVADEEG